MIIHFTMIEFKIDLIEIIMYYSNMYSIGIVDPNTIKYPVLMLT